MSRSAPTARARVSGSVVCTAFLVLWAGLCAAQNPPRETFTGETTTTMVEVPVEVLVDGRPVRGLTRESFEIFDRGDRREITGFEVVDLARGSGTTAEIPASGRRHFLLLFDLSFSRPRAIERSREAARDLILGALHPEDLVGVVTYSLSTGARWILPFTRDRDQAAWAIESLGLPELLPRPIDSLGLVLGPPRPDPGGLAGSPATDPTPGGGAGGGGGAEGRGPPGFAAEVVAALERTARAAERADALQRQAQIENLSRSLQELAEGLRAVEGRKHVVYLSEGFEASLLAGETGLEARRDLNRAVEGRELWNVRSEDLFGSRRMADTLTDMVEALERADCTVHSFDIGGLRAEGSIESGSMADREGLVMLARDTGGRFIENTNDLGPAVDEVLERTSVQYVLSFRADDVPRDGDWRRLKVEVKGLPRKARVVHRPGWFAPAAERTGNPARDRLEIARDLVSGREGGELDVDLFAFPSPSGAPVLVRGRFPALSGQTAEAEVHLYAFRPDDGKVLDFFSLRVPLEDGRAELQAPLDLPVGETDVRALVRLPELGVRGMERLRIEIADPTRPASVLAALVAAEEPAEGTVFRANRPELFADLANPFVFGDRPFVPGAPARIDPTRSADVPVVLYGRGLDETRQRVGARLLDANDAPIPGSSFGLLARSEGEDGWTRVLGRLRMPRGWSPPALLEVEWEGAGSVALEIEAPAGSGGGAAWFDPGVGGPVRELLGLEPAASRREGERSPEVDAAEIDADRRALRRRAIGAFEDLGGPDRDAALGRIEAFELELAASRPERVDRWVSAQVDLARDLARRHPELVVPLLGARHDLYRRHRAAGRSWLTHHALAATRDLARLLEGEEELGAIAAGALASLGGYLQEGLVATCLPLFEEALAIQPDQVAARLGRAAFVEKRGGPFADVVRDLERVLEIDPGHGQARLRLAVNLERLGRGARARQIFDELVTDPGIEPWIAGLAAQEIGRGMLRAGFVAEAIDHLEDALARWPADQKLALLLGLAADRAGRPDVADRAAAALLAAQSEGVRARSLYQEWPREDLDRARFDLATRAEELRPQLLDALRNLGEAS